MRGLTPPLLTSGFREGCGDAMLGALAGSWAQGESFEQALRVGAAAGAANYLRRGLAGSSREVIEGLVGAVVLERRLGARRHRLPAQHRGRRPLSGPLELLAREGAREPLEARREAHRSPGPRGVGVAAQHVYEPFAGERHHGAVRRAVGDELGRPLDLQAPTSTSAWRRSRRSAPAWRSGCATTVRVPRSASCSTSCCSPSPSGPGAGSSRTQPPAAP